ncbi:MAG: CDP-alcohol phosphatidyltransferase family protein [Clostridiales bacterium]|nr:CDP-alcohol phosphatidyltransferase family protein [Clostridiales bacterium]
MKNIPNYITTFRLILVPFFIYYLLKEMAIIAFLIFAIASWSDILDGYLARKFKVISNYGKIVDPLADKALQLSAVIVLCLIGRLRLIFILILILKEILLILGGVIVYKKKVIVPAKWYGKASSFFINIVIATIILFSLPQLVIDILMIISIVTMIFSLIMYIINYQKHKLELIESN